MNNPLKRNENHAVTAAAIVVSISAGIIAYLFLTKHGEALRKRLSSRKEEAAENTVSGVDVKVPKTKRKITVKPNAATTQKANT